MQRLIRKVEKGRPKGEFSSFSISVITLKRSEKVFDIINGPVAQLDTCLPAGREQLTAEQTREAMNYIYVLKSENNYRFYVGMTTDVDRRVKEHNSGKTKSTKGYRPWQLFFFEAYETIEEARAREKYLKSGIGKEFIKDKWSRSSAG